MAGTFVVVAGSVVVVEVVVVASWREARRHPWLALRAVMTGFVTLTLYFTGVQMIGRVIWVLSNGGYYIAGHWLTLPSRPLPSPPFDVLTLLAIYALAFALSGWAIVRFHRTHGIAMTMPFVFLTMLAALGLLLVVAADTGPGTRTMPVTQFITMFGTAVAAIPIGALAGGILGLRWKR